jgi:biopolymer transport protein ExbB/TolQ
MVEAFLMGGKVMWPLTLIAAGILWLTARTAWRIHQREHEAAETESSLQAILFWGSMSVVLGMLGTAIGWISATTAIGHAGGAEPALIWAGVGITLYSVTFGMLIFMTASLCWFVLRQWASRAWRLSGRRTSTAAI